MKAKVKSTGEIINVKGRYDEGYHKWVYTNVITNEKYYSSELDFEDIVDWEERRFQASQKFVAAILSNPDPCMHTGDNKEICKYSIGMADELIKQLKEK